jgi:Zn-dependent peptidase ImmA (M78 family)
MKKRKTTQEAIRQLYEKLLAASEIPIIESPDIHSKGMYLTRDGKQEIYIKQSLPVREKLKVLLHEYSHHIHLTHFFQGESRSETETIANGTAFFICEKYGLNIYKTFDLYKFSDDVDVVARLTAIIQTVAEHITKRMD